MIGGLRILEVLLPLLAITSPPDTVFTSAIGGAGEDWAFSLLETSRQELIFAGYYDQLDAGLQDAWLVCHDSNGDTLWSRTYGGSGSDQMLCVLPAPGNGFVCGGILESDSHGERDLWLTRIDSTGELLWSRNFGGPRRDMAHWMVAAPDGGYVLAGRTESYSAGGDMDAWVLKVNETGDSLWSKTYGGPDYDTFCNIVSQPDGYILSGITTSNARGSYDAWITKTDLQGEEIWSRQVGGDGDDRFRAAVDAGDGGCFAAGYTDSDGAGSFDAWLMRFDAAGNELWERTYGGISEEQIFMAICADSFLVMCGHTFSYGAGHADAWLLKVNQQGDSIWSKTFGGPENDDFWAVIETAEGGYAACGCTQSFSGDGSFDGWLVKTGPDTAAIEYVKSDELDSR